MRDYTHIHTYTHVCAVLSHSVMSNSLCDPMDCSPPGSSVHRIIEAGILEWVAIPSPEESSQPQAPTLLESLPSEPPEKRIYVRTYICTCVCIVSHSSQRGKKVKKWCEGHRGSRVLWDLKIGKSKMYVCVVGDGND